MRLRIAIVGAGPSGSSLAIRLARQDHEVTLIERETFPRHKLCGEFISPECLSHFEDLGVLDEMLAAGGSRITETRFYAPGGRSFSVSSGAFAGRGFALGLSRAQMDSRLLRQAGAVGVTVSEDSNVTAVKADNGRIDGLTARRGNGETFDVQADLYVDATGRARVLSKLLGKSGTGRDRQAHPGKSLFVGFKSHLKGASIAKGACEIYLFPGGYGGLSPVEVGLTNHCFMVKSSIAREFGGDADKIIENVVIRNKRAAETLADAEPVREWLAVSVAGFGRAEPSCAANLLSIGDSAAFIDPFTGSGMLMAFESAAVVAAVIDQNRYMPEAIPHSYRVEYDRKFTGRLRICSTLRRAAFLPLVPAFAVSFLSISGRSRGLLADATRSPKLRWPKNR